MSDNSEINPQMRKRLEAEAQFNKRIECVQRVLRAPENAPFLELLGMWRAELAVVRNERGEVTGSDSTLEGLNRNEGRREICQRLLTMAGM